MSIVASGREAVTPDPAFCQTGPGPLPMSAVLLVLLRSHFSSSDGVLDETLKSRIWVPGEESPVRIEDALVWQAPTADAVPAVLARRGDYKFLSKGIGDRSGIDLDGTEHFTAFWAGEHQLLCESSEPAEAEALGFEVARFFGHFRSTITSAIGLQRFRMTGLSKTEKIKEAQQRFVCRVGLEYCWDENWTLAPAEAVPFGSFVLQINPYAYSQFLTLKQQVALDPP